MIESPNEYASVHQSVFQMFKKIKRPDILRQRSKESTCYFSVLSQGLGRDGR